MAFTPATAEVMNLQLDLNKLGTSPKLDVDGALGPMTWAALIQQVHKDAAGGPVIIPIPPTTQTPWMDWMRSNIGQSEITGSPATPFDVMIFSHTDYGPLQGGLEDEGCAATACAALELTGYKSPHSALAMSFATYGTACDLKPGCIVVFHWSSGGHHVAFCTDIPNSTTVNCIGGNQNHSLNISNFPQSAIVATRWPIPADTTTSIPPVSASKIYGIDIYDGDDINSWQSAKASSHSEFCIMKATEGTGIIEKAYAPRMAAARAAGIEVLAAYHFFHPGSDAVQQANVFYNTAHASNPDFYCLDWEASDGTSASADKAAALKFLVALEAITKQIPWVYLSPGWAGDMGGLGNEFARYPLWIAHYGVSKPRVPAPWSDYTIWQYGSAAVAGINSGKNSTDADIYRGSIADLKAYLAKLKV